MQIPGKWEAMAIFMMEIRKPSRPGSWAPAQTLTHLYCSHHQHHHKTFLQHTHFSAPVPLAKPCTTHERAQWFLWRIHSCGPDHSTATGLCLSLNPAIVPKCPVGRVWPHQKMGANAHVDELWPPGASQDQGRCRIGRKRFILHFI